MNTAQKPKRIQIHPCIVKGCKGKDSDEISLYKIPPNDRKAWCMNLQINPWEVKSNTRVCSRHFEKKWQGLAKLKSGARPTLQLGKLKIKALSFDGTKPRFNPRKCCIIGCNITAPPHKLHKFPTDPTRYQEWLSICPVKTSAMQNKHKYICVNHFRPTDVEDFRLKKDAKPLASLCFSMQDDIAPPTIKKNLNQKTDPPESDKSSYTHSEYESDGTASSDSDGLECQNCENCVDYYSKYHEIEKQRKEAEARHLIETLALQNQIEELTVEIEKAKKLQTILF